ncbi:ATPase domain-containing protein [Bacteriovorax sp. Seq25_V]|uniref:ATPase domain-containing protein n=1 Tax=Bacteriovorax sp. Seq25_V TaxID=1201288 RepID=UPI00038A496B|nr:ATPase domain-containing protein [Bacteriovorax sp. Seq25_V]EQC43313.1 putative DNA repair protein RadA [Bacteriovorax sp. Seq25_V]
MAKSKIKFECSSCGYQTASWLGRCPECQKWNSFEEKIPKKQNLEIKLTKLIHINQNNLDKISTGIHEYDKANDGGLVQGSLNLLCGEPGVGKSTLILELANKLGKADEEILYVSGEESCEQIALRANRLNVNNEYINIATEVEISKILTIANSIRPKFLIIDSIQTIRMEEIRTNAGGVAQIREVTLEILNYIKAKNITCFLIGHITKDGQIAGPKLLEHMVDVVMHFEKVLGEELRMLKVVKNRYGSTNDIGLFELKENRLIEIQEKYIKKVSHEFNRQMSGTAYTVLRESNREILIEVEALVVEGKGITGKRIIRSGDQARLSMILAVMEKHLKIDMNTYDIYININGTIKDYDEQIDSCILVAILSSLKKIDLNSTNLYTGSISLNGAIRVKDEIKIKGFETIKASNVNELAARCGQ